jgi:hypothetical protein
MPDAVCEVRAYRSRLCFVWCLRIRVTLSRGREVSPDTTAAAKGKLHLNCHSVFSISRGIDVKLETCLTQHSGTCLSGDVSLQEPATGSAVSHMNSLRFIMPYF